MSFMTLCAIWGIVVLLALLFLGMHIGLAMTLVGFAGYAIVVNFNAAIGVLRNVPASQASNFALVVIPLFILMGNFAFASGMSEGLYSTGNKWLSGLPGGLSCATIAACAGFGAVCGSVPATTATMGAVAIPEMRRYRYSDTLSTGSVAVGGTLGIIIPPSTPMVVYGIIAEQSIGRLFLSGVIPGIILTIILCATVIIMVKRNPSLAGPSVSYTWQERLASLKELTWMAVLFVCVFFMMFSGIFTINEAAAGGAFLALLITLVRGRLTWKTFTAVMYDSIKTTSMVFLVLIGAIIFGNFLAITRLPMVLAASIASLAVSKYAILALIIVIYAILGCFMDALPMIMLTVPIFLPIILELGFDPIWFNVVIILVMQLGCITPPVGLSCYVVSGIARDIPLSTIFRGAIPFCLGILLTIVLVTALPGLATWLPALLLG
ncbi:C4-dicarboxylate ABC transporter permease [Betaproteobacteria bacterium]|nr:C4-dicarboxylate ABC transporter permease [Betaproteobacteria bacterium]